MKALRLFEEVRIRNLESRKWFYTFKYLLENAHRKAKNNETKKTLQDLTLKIESVYFGNDDFDEQHETEEKQ